MNKFMLANRRKQGMTLEQFNYEWGVIHVAVMLTTPSAMQIFRRYVQGYTLADVDGQALAYPLSPQRWDGFASLSFETLDDFARSMEEPDYLVRARPHDFSDPAMVLELTGEEVIFDDLTAPEEDAVKLVHFLRRAPGVGREQFASAWRAGYAAAVTEATRDAKGLVRKYVQNPTLGLEGSPFEGSAYAQGMFGSFGGIEEFFFASRADFDAFTADAGTREFLLKRGAGIVDPDGSFSIVVTDRLRFASAPSPDGASVYCWAPPGLEVRSIPGVWSGPVG
ncbi:EthD domain-containing protein [Trebonia sp.]|uniref:EthD domain-containing protein n=1 Tax=Trebonia sp. TaxID=2767075 RepID=UPI00260FFE5B|nr:EthD domain-containing protein [Trebonia sp.]